MIFIDAAHSCVNTSLMAFFTALHCLLAAALLPLAGFLMLLMFGRRFGRDGGLAGPVSLTLALLSFALSLTALILWVARPGFNQVNDVEAFTYPWVALPAAVSGDPLSVPAAQAITVGCLIDSLTIAMFVVMTLLSVFVHLFAVGSVKENRARFFAFMGFLQFGLLSMLLANSLPQVFISWSLMSVAVYFLVAISPGEPNPNSPALRILLFQFLGDGAFLLGIGILLLHTGSFNGLTFFDAHRTSVLADSVSQTLNVRPSEYIPSPGAGFLDIHWLTWTGICFIAAALARMGQFPFQNWASRAAEAPAPIAATLLGGSALASGVYLLARIHPLLTLDARLILAIVGSVTLALATIVSLVQTDIRKALAWSAVSQGGYVLLFLGAGGYTAGILHLFTHAFTRTALFLAAGSVLYGFASADLRRMGGLWKRFPITAAAALVCVLALAGAPWMSGAYSTNLGLSTALNYADAMHQSTGSSLYLWMLYRIPAIVTYLTALSAGRWWWLIFAGPNRDARLLEGAHESAFLTLPIIILAGTSVGFWYEFSGIQALIGKSIPSLLLPADGLGLVIKAIDSASNPAFPQVIRQTGWSFLGLALAAGIYFNGLAVADRLRRLPGVKVIDYWLRQGMFFEELFEALLGVVLVLARVVRILERALNGLLRMILGILMLPVRAVAAIEKPRHRHDADAPLPPPDHSTPAAPPP